MPQQWPHSQLPAADRRTRQKQSRARTGQATITSAPTTCCNQPPSPRCRTPSAAHQASALWARGTPSTASQTPRPRRSPCSVCARLSWTQQRARSRSAQASSMATLPCSLMPRDSLCTTSPRCRTSPSPGRSRRPHTAPACATATSPRQSLRLSSSPPMERCTHSHAPTMAKSFAAQLSASAPWASSPTSRSTCSPATR